MAIDDIVDTLVLVSSEDELIRARTSIDNRLKELEKEEIEQEEKETLEETEPEEEEDD